MTTTWTIGVDAETAELRERLSKKFPLVSKHRLAKLCLAYGVRAAARCPELLLGADAATDNSNASLGHQG
jgi:hypothetical protein